MELMLAPATEYTSAPQPRDLNGDGLDDVIIARTSGPVNGLFVLYEARGGAPTEASMFSLMPPRLGPFAHSE